MTKEEHRGDEDADEASPVGRLRTSFGYMSLGGANKDRLIRLADVLRWIEKNPCVTRKEAVDLLVEQLSDEVVYNCVYEIHSQDRPSCIESGSLVLYRRQSAIVPTVFRGLNAASDRQRYAIGVGASLYGAAGIRQRICEIWVPWAHLTGDQLDNVEELIARLAVPIAKAQELWGYGAGASAAAAAGAKAAKPQLPPNTAEDNRKLFEEWEKAGGKKGGTARLFDKYGVTAKTIQNRIRSIRNTFESDTDRATRQAKGKAGRAGRATDLATVWPGKPKTGTHGS